jgi:parallel beta-helix repeat protein
MQIKKRASVAAALVAAAVAVVIAVAPGASAHRTSTTYNVTSTAQLNTALAVAVAGDTIILSGRTYYTADDTDGDVTDGFNLPGGVLLTGKTLNGVCTKTATTILDGDAKPGNAAAHTGKVLTIDGNGARVQCLTVRFGTTGIYSDGWNGLNVKSAAFVGNGRDLAAGSDGDSIYVQDGNGVKVNKTTFIGDGHHAIQSDVSVNVNNTSWIVQGNTFNNIAYSCIAAFNNASALISGNTCNTVGFSADAIDVEGTAVAGTPNTVTSNTVKNSYNGCYYISGDNTQLTNNKCGAAHDDYGAELYGNGVVASGNTFGLTYNACIYSNDNNQQILNNTCGQTREYGIEVFGDNTIVSNLTIGQTYNTCLYSNGFHETWTTVTCGSVTGTGGSDYGMYAGAQNSTYTGIAIGHTYDACFYSDNTNQTFNTISCKGVSDSYGIESTSDNFTVNGFDFGATYSGCVYSNGSDNATIKNGHCARVLQDEAVNAFAADTTIDKVVVDAAYGICFYVGGDNSTLTNSTGSNCGLGDTDQGIYWYGVGNALISNNVITNTYSTGLYVTVTGGDFTVTNNKVTGSQWSDCVNIYTPDTLTLSGNTAKQCYDSALDAGANTNPTVTSNTGKDTSFDTMMDIHCYVDCTGAVVGSNTLDGGQDEQNGLLVTNDAATDPGLTVTNNTIMNVSGHGLVTSGDHNYLSGNSVKNAGVSDNYFGIWLNSNDNTLTGSTVTGGFDNAIEISGNDNNVHDNVNITANDEDGIHVASGNDNIVNANTVTANHGEGIENDGATTVISNNNSYKNRQDCAGTGTTNPGGVAASPGLGGNTCADGTDFTDVGPITVPNRTPLATGQSVPTSAPAPRQAQPAKQSRPAHHVAGRDPNTPRVMPIR